MNTVSGKKAALHVSFGLVVLVCAGCGSPSGTMSGTVTYKSKPLTGGSVTFLTETGSATGTIDASGTYKVEDVPLGQAKISVFSGGGPPPMKMPGGGKDRGAGQKDLPPEAQQALKGGKQGTPGATIPAKYNDASTSDLKVEVKSGNNPPFNIELKD